jgi:hypothetical protein
MTLSDLLALIKSGHYLPLIAILTLYARKLASPASGFPVLIPQRWLGTVTAAGGLLYGFVFQLSTGSTVVMALLPALAAAGAGGFFDGLLTAIFNHDNAPKWARALVFVFDDATTGGVPPVTKPADPPAPPPSAPITPPVATRIGMFAAVLLIVSTTDCAGGTINVPPNVPPDVAGAIACVISDLIAQKPLDNCIAQYGQTLIDDALIIALDSKALAAEHPEAIKYGAQLSHK